MPSDALPGDRRARAVAARKTRSDQPEKQACQGHPIRPVALGGPDALHRRRPHRTRQQHRRALHPPKNALFAGSDGGAEHWAPVASLIETCKLNDIDPLAYLTDVLTRGVNGHPNRDIDQLLPRAYKKQELKAVATGEFRPRRQAQVDDINENRPIGLAELRALKIPQSGVSIICAGRVYSR